MQRIAANLTIGIIAVLAISVSLAMAHGTRHAGSHGGDAECVKPIQEQGMMGMGYWENNCGYGVHVKWTVGSEEGAGCRPRSDAFLPCLTYVKANSKETAHTSDNSGRGRVLWIACKAESSASGPFPVFHKVRPDKTVEYGCYHFGYGPGQTADKITPVDRIMRAAKRSNLRSGPGTDHEKVGLLEIGEEVQVTGEIEDWLRIKAPSGREAFVYTPLLTHAASVATKPLGAKWTVVENQACQIWFDQENVISATWSGRCVDGKASGAGRSVLRLRGNPNGATFVGVIRGGKASGHGTYTLSNDDLYEGQWRNGKLASARAGDKKAAGTEIHFQKITYADGFRYEGQMRDSRWHGRGTLTWPDGHRYEGDFVDGKIHGQGTLFYADGRRYEGDFVDNDRTGRGILTWPDGNRYEGDFVNGNRTGHGTYIWPNGDRYEGDFVDGKRTGWGTQVSANGRVKEGEWQNGKLVRLSERLKRQRRLERERRDAEWEREEAEWERQEAEERRRMNQARQNNALENFNSTLQHLQRIRQLEEMRRGNSHRTRGSTSGRDDWCGTGPGTCATQ